MKKQNVQRKKGVKIGFSYHLMMAPAMVFLLIFSYIPMFGIIMAFQDFVPAKGIWNSKWVGLENFRNLFQGRDIYLLLRNTIVISLGKILFGLIAAVLFAILLNEIKHRFLKKTVQTVTYLPHFLSWVILASVISNFFNLDGQVNQWLASMGFDKINFLGSNKLFQPLLIFTHVWKEFGYGSIVYLAAITAIDPGLHEAAAIDGASWWQRVWHVTLPGMLSIIILCVAMDVSGILSAGFDQVFNLYNVRVFETGDILDTYVYRVGLISRKYSPGTAVGLFKSIVGMVLMLSVNKFSEKFAQRSIF